MEPAGPRQPVQPNSGKTETGKKSPSPPKEVKAAQEALKKKAENEDIVIGAPTGFKKVTGASPGQPNPVKPESPKSEEIIIGAPTNFRKVTGASPDQPNPVKSEPAAAKPAAKVSQSQDEAVSDLEQEFVHIKDFAMGVHNEREYKTQDVIIPVIFALQFHPELSKTEGVFRLSGDNQKKEELITKLLDNPNGDLEELKAGNLPITVLTDTIKTFLKELKPKLLETTDSFDKIDRIVKIENPQAKLQALVHYLSALSQDQKLILLKLLSVADTIMQNREQTKMTANNLATTPGPLLMPDIEPNDPNVFVKMKIFSDFAKLIFENSSEIKNQVTF